MGPGCFYPGNNLQPDETEAALISLQWGRDVSIPEMHAGLPLRWSIRCFNGAGMFLSRKCVGITAHMGAIAASMGPGCFYPGNAAGRRSEERREGKDGK